MWRRLKIIKSSKRSVLVDLAETNNAKYFKRLGPITNVYRHLHTYVWSNFTVFKTILNERKYEFNWIMNVNVVWEKLTKQGVASWEHALCPQIDLCIPHSLFLAQKASSTQSMNLFRAYNIARRRKTIFSMSDCHFLLLLAKLIGLFCCGY